jgi:hypothetical protein
MGGSTRWDKSVAMCHWNRRRDIIAAIGLSVLSLAGTLAQRVDATPCQPGRTLLVAELNVEEVRRLRASGSIMPLEEVLRQIARDYPGRIIEIELEEEDGLFVYELELVDDGGFVWEIEIDARTGALLGREQED